MKKNKPTDKERVLNGLQRRAEGLEAEERIVEYVLDEDGTRRAVKEKTQYKYYPPDVAAAKACLELAKTEDDFSALSDEDIEMEKLRLLRELENLSINAQSS